MSVAQRLRKWIPRDPLVQLLLVGVMLFGADHLLNGAEDQNRIAVDETGLVNFMQYRNRAFDAGRFQDRLSALSGEELADLVDQYVEEEALVRKARSMGLDRNDYVARRRLVSQMEYLIDANAENAASGITPAEIESYYRQHGDELRKPVAYDFRHVFVDRDSPEDAGALLQRLAGGGDWRELGDRFPYEREWRKADEKRIADTFGADFAKSLSKIRPGMWQGPVASQWGSHLVFIEHAFPGAKLTFAQAEPIIRDRIAQEREAGTRQQEIHSLVSDYKVTYDDTIARKMGRN